MSFALATVAYVSIVQTDLVSDSGVLIANAPMIPKHEPSLQPHSNTTTSEHVHMCKRCGRDWERLHYQRRLDVRQLCGRLYEERRQHGLHGYGIRMSDLV